MAFFISSARWPRTLDSMEATYVLWTPVEEFPGGYRAGGPVCIRMEGINAYIAFGSIDLAEQFRARAKLTRASEIVEISELGKKYPVPTADPRMLVRFPDTDVVERYFSDRDSFPYAKYTVPAPSTNAA